MNSQAPFTAADPSRAFASDNWAGAHQEVIDAIVAANTGHAPSYGADDWTNRFDDIMRQHFGADARAFPVLNGTGANVLALQSALPRWGAVVCADTAHINTDETGAPEKTGGLKLLQVPTPDGKLTPELVDTVSWGRGVIHRAQPLAVSISQSTEWGTGYTPDEIRELAEHVHAQNMILHIDGSRLGNAAAHFGTSLGALAEHADIVSLGGTKNGLIGAEAVVVLNPDIANGIAYLRKTVLQLGSKMRFISAQLNALYEGDLWLRSARHANTMATRLAAGLEQLGAETASAERSHAEAAGAVDTTGVATTADDLGPVRVVQAVQSNAVFAEIPSQVAAHARTRFAFADWKGLGVVRLMCSFDTTPDDVDELVALVREGLTRRGPSPRGARR